MPATFNHTIIASLDGSASARFYTELLEAEPAPSWGPFINITLTAASCCSSRHRLSRSRCSITRFSSPTPISTGPAPGSSTRRRVLG